MSPATRDRLISFIRFFHGFSRMIFPGQSASLHAPRGDRVSHGARFLCPWLFSTAEARTSNSPLSRPPPDDPPANPPRPPWAWCERGARGGTRRTQREQKPRAEEEFRRWWFISTRPRNELFFARQGDIFWALSAQIPGFCAARAAIERHLKRFSRVLEAKKNGVFQWRACSKYFSV